MNEISVRRVAATLTIGSFSIAALMGIVALLGGGDFGEGEARVLLTTLVVGCASICMLCYLATGGTRFVLVGVAGAAALVLPVATALILVWSDWDDVPEGLLKTFGIGVVVAATLAQICLLVSDVEGRSGLIPILTATVVLAAVLAGLISGLILGAIDNGEIWRLLGVVAILDVLGTLVTIALAKFGGTVTRRATETGRAPDALVAEAVELYLKG